MLRYNSRRRQQAEQAKEVEFISEKQWIVKSSNGGTS